MANRYHMRYCLVEMSTSDMCERMASTACTGPSEYSGASAPKSPSDVTGGEVEVVKMSSAQ